MYLRTDKKQFCLSIILAVNVLSTFDALIPSFRKAFDTKDAVVGFLALLSIETDMIADKHKNKKSFSKNPEGYRLKGVIFAL